MKFEDLTQEMQVRARACKTPEDILALAKQEGYDLSDEELEAISAGEMLGWCHDFSCTEMHIM